MNKRTTAESPVMTGGASYRLGLAMVAVATMLLSAAASAVPPSWAEGRILMAPKPGLPEHALARILANADARAIERIQGLLVRVVAVPPGAEERIVEALSRNPHVAFAELDRAVELSEVIPNDPNYGSAWHLATMGASTAWSVSTGNAVTVAVLDSGVDAAHPDLGANMLPGWNSVLQNGDSADLNGHGTKVAGTIAAVTDNGIGVASLAFHSKILPIRVSNNSDGWAYWSDIARGVSWAADHGAKVANISYDASGSSSITSAAQYMRNKGGVVVVAAGNSGGDPGHAPNEYLISVSATNSSDTRPNWSSYGNYVDFAAPGVGIWTTTMNGGYGTPSGTSFSSPATAAVVAQIMGVNPALSPSQIESILQKTVVDLGGDGWDPYYGFGRVDAAAAVQMAYDSSGNDAEPPSVAITTPSHGSEVSELTTISVEASDNFGVNRVDLLIDASVYASDSVAPYAFSWDASLHNTDSATIVASAIDEAGNQSDSAAVTVSVAHTADSAPPELEILQPADGALVSGRVTLSAAATDDVAMEQIGLYVGGDLMCSGTDSTSCAWNTRKFAEGSTQTITAIAADTSGNKVSASVSVTISSGGSDDGGGGKGPDKDSSSDSSPGKSGKNK